MEGVEEDEERLKKVVLEPEKARKGMNKKIEVVDETKRHFSVKEIF